MFVSPAKIIEMLDVRPPMAVADFGSGSGHYVIEAAKKVGKSGKVYAVDILQEMLGFTRSQAQSLNLTNIETIWTDLETPEATRLKENSIDLIIMSNILFQAENKEQVIREASRILKPGGEVVIIEWDTENQPSSFGPPMDKRISPQNAKTLFAVAGFSVEKEFNPGDQHYALVFRKNKL